MKALSDFTDRSITEIKGVGDACARLFAKLGVDTVGSLLLFFPRCYEDWSSSCSLIDATAADEAVYLRARVISGVDERCIRAGMTLSSCRASDENGSVVKLTFFNNPYISRMLEVDKEYIFHGKVTFDQRIPQMNSPIFRPTETCGEPVPVYHQAKGLTSRRIAQTVRKVLDALPADLPDPIPADIRKRYGLCGFRDALINIHRPTSMDDIASARRRLVFDELLELQTGLLLLRNRGRGKTGVRLGADRTEEFYGLLPFEPTGAQRRAVGDGIADMMAGERPMSRLVQGDVGSGKTVVAAAMCFCCAREGIQSALMAPTEILAEQHYATLSGLLRGSGITVELLTGSTTAARKRDIYARLADGGIDIIVGTHALLSGGVAFARLGLVITDEQHRFGVAQRAALAAKGSNPHMLVMSATPIPRTLALIIFGDLDVSVIDELPAGRKPILTYWIDSPKRERAYGFIRRHLDAGRQAYIVCPLVEEGESELTSAEGLAAQLSAESFADYSVGLLHGRMKPQDKEYVMRRFKEGEIQLLVSTTVIEVGVDVPNAVIMLVENADRFGLSQLHQLRGRVGRGEEQSYCILLCDARGGSAVTRMRTMTATNDGFTIAQEDLKLRGPGDFFGEKQHGLPELRLADFENDMDIFTQAQEAARAILSRDPALALEENAPLRSRMTDMFKDTAIFN